MKVEIVKAGIYSHFSHGKVGARQYEIGDIETYPDWYAQKLLAWGFVIEIPTIKVMTEPVVVPAVDPSTAIPSDDEPVIPDIEFVDKPEEIDITARARSLADELGIDIVVIAGTGRDGRITIKDVREAAA